MTFCAPRKAERLRCRDFDSVAACEAVLARQQPNRASSTRRLLAMAVLLTIPSVMEAQDKPDPPPPTPSQAKTGRPHDAGPAWQPLFDGKSLEGWKATNFGGEGEVIVKDGKILLGFGSPLTGITYTGKLPTRDYELHVQAMRLDGSDFFSTVTFPVNDSFCSLVVGGWGGAVVGISCINRADASENETTSYYKFESDKWYDIRIQVRKDHLRAWIDNKKVVDLDIRNRKLSTRTEVFLSEPCGIANYMTRAAIRKIELRKLPAEAKK